MDRNSLNVLTKISFYTACVTIIGVVILIYLGITSEENTNTINDVLGIFVFLAFLVSLFGIPLSIVSMFSKEKLGKRIFALILNLSPVILVTWIFIIEAIREFSETPL